MLSHGGQLILGLVNLINKKNTASSKERSLTRQSTTICQKNKRNGGSLKKMFKKYSCFSPFSAKKKVLINILWQNVVDWLTKHLNEQNKTKNIEIGRVVSEINCPPFEKK